MLAENQYAEAFYEQLTRVRPAPKIPEWERILDKLKQYAETAARDQMTVDQALAALDRDVDRILEKRRWMLAQDE